MLLFNLWVVGLSITFLFQDVDTLPLINQKYTAAVVEYYMRYNGTLESHTEEYLSLINKITQTKGIDIIVFPESGLTGNLWKPNRESILYYTTFVPDPQKNIAPCTDADQSIQYSDTLRKISCAAGSNETYIVINLLEKEICTEELQIAQNDSRPCAPDGFNFYNTDVVFNRKGVVVARYRKVNLFGEDLLNTTSKPELVTFQTDFCVEFGIFTCFDILFDTPANELLNSSAKNFIFPTMWFSELPFLTAVQAQYMWAYTHKVNFLAAGISQPSLGSTGSSIYSAKDDSLKAVMSDGKETKIIIKELKTPKNKSCHATYVQKFDMAEEDISAESPISEPEEKYTTTDLHMKIDDLELYESILINKTNLNKEFNKTLQHGYLKCKFSIKIDSNEMKSRYPIHKKSTTTTTTSEPIDVTDWIYHYRLVAFDGVRTFSGVANGGVQICGLIACTNETLASCGHRFPSDISFLWPFIFEQIVIEGNFSDNTTVPFLNSVTGTSLLPIPAKYTFSNQSGHFQLTGRHKDIYTFAIYARNFNRDGEEVTTKPNSSAQLSTSVFWMLFSYVASKIPVIKML